MAPTLIYEVLPTARLIEISLLAFNSDMLTTHSRLTMLLPSAILRPTTSLETPALIQQLRDSLCNSLLFLMWPVDPQLLPADLSIRLLSQGLSL